MSHLPDHLNDLHRALLQVDDAPLECDGHSLMVSLALARENIPHQRVIGHVCRHDSDFVLSPHCWIMLDGYIVDYRLRMWIRLHFGVENAAKAPHGIFPCSSSRMQYRYQQIQHLPATPMDEDLLNIITDGYSSRLQLPQSFISRFSLQAG
ncbi:hypothetical protein ABKU49_05810 [Enterobacter hormaechei]